MIVETRLHKSSGWSPLSTGLPPLFDASLTALEIQVKRKELARKQDQEMDDDITSTVRKTLPRKRTRHRLEPEQNPEELKRPGSGDEEDTDIAGLMSEFKKKNC